MWSKWFGKKQSAKPPIIIVSGLPRAGTSMMMHMLKAGGVEVIVDDRRQADADNPRGYWEFEPVKHIAQDSSWLETAHGKAVKMVSMLLYELPQDKQYTVIFMQRDLDEVLASQKIMLRRNNKVAKDNDEEMKHLFTAHLAKIATWLAAQNHIKTLYVNYAEVVNDPARSAQAINAFLGGRFDPQKMVAVMDTSLYRNRAQASLPQRPLSKGREA